MSTPSQTYPATSPDPLDVIIEELKWIRQQIHKLRAQEEILEKVLRTIAPGVHS